MRSTTSSQFNVTGEPDEGWATLLGEGLKGSLAAGDTCVETAFSATGGVEEGGIVVALPLGVGRVGLGGAIGFSVGAWTLGAGFAGGGVDATDGNAFASGAD